MPCVCTNNTLRLFIRNVAQLDLPIAAKLSASGPRQFSRRQLPALNYAHASKSYSSASMPQHQDHFDDSIEPAPLRGEAWRATRSGMREESTDGLLSYASEGGAIVDFSPEAIDAIAAEAAAEKDQHDHEASTQTHEYDTPWRSLQRDMPRRQEYEDYVPTNRTQEPSSRRGESKSQGFKLRYSAAPDWKKVEDHGERLRAKRERETAAEKAREEWVPPPKEPWMIAKEKVKEKYPDGWNPLKRLSPDAIAGIRALHSQMPEQYTPWILAEEFKVSAEAIQRILRTKWRPSADEQTDREARWHKRGERVWGRLAELGTKPPVAWRELGIGAGKPDWMKKRENPRPRTPLPALITTARRREVQTKPRRESLEDRII